MHSISKHRTVYLGLCNTYHDPALALVDESGEVLFAEATERPLQYKRALNCEADNPFILPALLQTYAPAAERLVIRLTVGLASGPGCWMDT